jgi:hypothetical protein
MVRRHGAVALIAVVAAGCRINFDELSGRTTDGGGDGSVDAAGPDTSGVAMLTCNMGLRVATLGPVTTTTVSAAATGSGLIAAWLRDDGAVVGLSVGIAGSAAVAGPEVTLVAGGVTSVSLAAHSGAVLLATTPVGATSRTQLTAYDDHLLASTPRPELLYHVPPHALAENPGTGYLVAGMETGVVLSFGLVALDAAAGVTASQAVAFTSQDIVGVVTLPTAYVALSAAGGQCGATATDRAMTTVTPTFAWTGANCADVAIGAIPGHADFLAARRDNTDGDIQFALGRIAGGTPTIDAVNRLADPPTTTPRIATTPDAYYVAYATTGTLFDKHVDVAGTASAPRPLGPVAGGAAYDVVTLNGTTYAVWIQGGAASSLWLAPLCP